MALSAEEIKEFYNQEDVGFIKKIELSFTSPQKLFSAAKSETGITGALVYSAAVSFAIVLILYALIVTVLSAIPVVGPLFGAMLLMFGPVFVIVLWLSMVGGAFVSSALVYAVIHLTGGRKSFSETYKAFAYTAALQLLVAIPVAGVLYVMYVHIKGISILNEISAGKALVAYIAPMAVVMLIAAAAVASAGLMAAGGTAALQNDETGEKLIAADSAYLTGVTIRNVGKTVIRGADISVYKSDSRASCRLPDTIAPRATAECIWDGDCNPGEAIKIFGPDNSITVNCPLPQQADNPTLKIDEVKSNYIRATLSEIGNYRFETIDVQVNGNTLLCNWTVTGNSAVCTPSEGSFACDGKTSVQLQHIYAQSTRDSTVC